MEAFGDEARLKAQCACTVQVCSSCERFEDRGRSFHRDRAGVRDPRARARLDFRCTPSCTCTRLSMSLDALMPKYKHGIQTTKTVSDLGCPLEALVAIKGSPCWMPAPCVWRGCIQLRSCFWIDGENHNWKLPEILLPWSEMVNVHLRSFARWPGSARAQDAAGACRNR